MTLVKKDFQKSLFDGMEFKHVRVQNGPDGALYNAEVSVNGKYVATIKYDGFGGPSEVLNYKNPNDIQILDAYVREHKADEVMFNDFWVKYKKSKSEICLQDIMEKLFWCWYQE
jgi:hypothetical protein